MLASVRWSVRALLAGASLLPLACVGCKQRGEGASSLRESAQPTAAALLRREFDYDVAAAQTLSGVALTAPAMPPVTSDLSPEARRGAYTSALMGANAALPEGQANQVLAATTRAFYAAFEIVARNPYGTPPPDQSWPANALIADAAQLTDLTLGDAQGAQAYQGHLYIYGDLAQDQPRVGVIREYDYALKATGRFVMLTRHGLPVSIHPSGLSFDDRYGAVLSDTWQHKGTLYRLDWARAWADGTLDNAILGEVKDDAAVNGSRATFVTLNGRTLLASADYGDTTPALRLYDAEALLNASATSAPGVLVATIKAKAFNQNLYWDNASGRIYMTQNVLGGLGWRVDVLNLAAAAEALDADAPGVRVETRVYIPHDELEGWTVLPNGQELFVTSSYRKNLTLGHTQTGAPRTSGFGDYRIDDRSDDEIQHPN